MAIYEVHEIERVWCEETKEFLESNIISSNTFIDDYKGAEELFNQIDLEGGYADIIEVDVNGDWIDDVMTNY